MPVTPPSHLFGNGHGRTGRCGGGEAQHACRGRTDRPLGKLVEWSHGQASVPRTPATVARMTLQIWPVTGIGEIAPGTDLAGVLAEALAPEVAGGDVVVVTQKVVSKAEGRVVPVDPDDPQDRIRIIRSQARRILRRRGDLLVTETAQGFVCASAGVDLSNMATGTAALLPEDSDRSARRIRDRLRHELGVTLGVIVSDTFGRTWRRGLTDVAIGCAGIAAVHDLRGTTDANGMELQATEMCVADEIAGAAELVMGKDRGVPAAVVRGVPTEWFRESSAVDEIVRPPAEDLFR